MGLDCVQICAYKVLIGALSYIQATCIFLGGISYITSYKGVDFPFLGVLPLLAPSTNWN